MVTQTLDERRLGEMDFRPGVARGECAVEVQQGWTARTVQERLNVLRAWRNAISEQTEAFCRAVHAEPARTEADVLVTEILPLLAACEFLEKNSAKVLSVRHVGRRGRAVWLGRVRSQIHRVALGRVLVIGPSNYPLFLPGVQVLQALAAGNGVTWKPGRGGAEVARLFASTIEDAGLPRGLLRLTDDTEEAGKEAVAAGADKVFFTGSAASGQAVMRSLAMTCTPSVMELSDSAAVIVLPEANIGRVVAAIVFGIRLNGSSTCMAPRRLMVIGTALRKELVARLTREFAKVRPVPLSLGVSALLKKLVDEARAEGATLIGLLNEGSESGLDGGQRPLLMVGVRPEMRVAQTDIFAPILSVIDVSDVTAILEAQSLCPLALTVSIFGDETVARGLAERMSVGTAVINDLIAPTADPRIPFGGRRGSGFGATRGREGLLEMTAAKTVMVQRGKSLRQYEATGEAHVGLFRGLILAGHAKSWMRRWFGIRSLIAAGRSLQAGQETKQHGKG